MLSRRGFLGYSAAFVWPFFARRWQKPAPAPAPAPAPPPPAPSPAPTPTLYPAETMFGAILFGC
jgi:hypothetical protein